MDPQQVQAMHVMAVMFPLIGFFVIVGIVIVIVPLWRICTKAGMSGALSLIALFPGIGTLIVLYVIAFSDWKVIPAPQYAAYPPQYPPPPAYPPASYPPPGPSV